MKNNPFLKTTRLILRPVSLEDASDLFTVYSDAQVMRFMETPPHTRISDTQTKITEMTAGNACYWSICLKEDGKAIGNIGYLGNMGVPGMGYILGVKWQRQGFMSEAIQPALEYGFKYLDFDRVELWIHQDNLPSQRLAHKTGFTRRGCFRIKYNHQPEAHEMWVYGLYRSEWRHEPGFPSLQCYTVQPILSVQDVKATAEYYRDTLAFNIDFYYGDPPTHASVSCAEWTVEGAHIQLSQSTESNPSLAGIALYIFVGADIEARYDLYRSRGVTIERELAVFPWGMREFSIRDCNGCLLRFGTPG
jgi:RimJ/RimL family protein N-acetyltransferase/uncharacterized glyoxalase superfamily protein PhnB